MIKKFIKPIINNLHFHKQEKEDIYIFSTPRSGSTWLMEIIGSQKGIKLIDEPLAAQYIKNYISFKEKKRYISLTNKEKQQIVKYFDNISSNKIDIMRQYRYFTSSHNFITNRSVIKIIRGCELIYTLNSYLSNMKKVILLRHPIPTCLSRIRNCWNFYLDYIKEFIEDDHFCDKYLNKEKLDFFNEVIKSGTKLEIFVLCWVVENLPLFSILKEKDNNILFLTYEDMVVNTEDIIKKLYKNLSLKSIDDMLKHVNIPSFSSHYSKEQTIKNIENKNSNYLISKWKSKISDTEEEKCFRILEYFNIELYKKGELLPTKQTITLLEGKIIQ